MDRTDHDRHHPVEEPTELAALAVEGPRTGDHQPHAVQAARNGVHLHAEGGHRKAVDHVDRTHQETDGGVHGEEEGGIHLEHAALSGGEGGVIDQEAVEAEVRSPVGVLVAPVPLVSNGLHRELGVHHLVHEVEEAQGGEANGPEDEGGREGPPQLQEVPMALTAVGQALHRVEEEGAEEPPADNRQEEKEVEEDAVVEVHHRVHPPTGRILEVGGPALRGIRKEGRERHRRQGGGRILPRHSGRDGASRRRTPTRVAVRSRAMRRKGRRWAR